MISKRASGVLLHPTSLPGKFGIGTLGKEAYNFIDFLIESGQKLWQVCPLGPTGYGDSPYQCFSAFAGNPLLIDLELLQKEGLLSKADLGITEDFDENLVDFGRIINHKFPLLQRAYENFKKHRSVLDQARYENFVQENREWLSDYALFMALKSHYNGKPWYLWDDDIRLRKHDSVVRYKSELADLIDYQKFVQYKFFNQWLALKHYANQNYIKIIGDIPLYIAHDSADAWANSDLFQFDENRNPTGVAGVPPDYFSETGQLWGNPLYNWESSIKDGFSWWIKRIQINLVLSDIIRIDHFRGLSAYWRVGYGEKTAINGEWVPAAGMELFQSLRKKLGKLPIIAEDLGLITPDVIELRDEFNFPGMKILQFAFDSEEDNAVNFLPHNYPQNSVVYTGTHDNDTVKGWYLKAREKDRKYAADYLNFTGNDISWNFIRSALSSAALIAIIPLQDILGLGSEARMNTPGTPSGNWQWRFRQRDLKQRMQKKLHDLTKLYKR